MNKLDLEGRSAVKSLFNVSKFSRNYLNALLDIDHLSTIITRNKLNLCCRLMKNTSTRKILLSTMENNTHPCFSRDINAITEKLNSNLYDIIINLRYPNIYSYHEVIPEYTLNTLLECINFWNLKIMRSRFKSILEERVVRQL